MSDEEGFVDEEVEAMIGGGSTGRTPGVKGRRYVPYDAEKVEELKSLGLPKPDDCSWGDWTKQLAGDLSHRHDLVIMYAAHGKRISEIAAELDFSAGHVSGLLQSKEIKAAVKKRQAELFENKHRKRIEAMINPALDVLDSLLHNMAEKSTVRADIAKYLIDQGAGKAKQEIHHDHSTLNDFFERLENKSREIKDITMKLAEPKDHLDNFVDEHVPDSFTVGDKNAQESEPEQGLHPGDRKSPDDDGFETEDWF